VDDLLLFVAPVILGERGLPSIGASNWALTKAPRMKVEESCRVGDDVMIRLQSAGR